jgi:hypothetical protein
VPENGRPKRRPKEEGDSGDQKESKSKEVSMQTSKDDNTRTDTTATLEPLTEASAKDWLGSNQDPDVLLAIPNLGIDHIGIEVDNLRADVQLHAKVLDLLELSVGAQVSIEKVEVNIENVRVQAMLKVRLDEVYKIVDRVMTTIDENPEILTNLTGGVGKGVENALSGGTGGSNGGGDSKDLDGSIEGKTKVEKGDQEDQEDQEE